MYLKTVFIGLTFLLVQGCASPVYDYQPASSIVNQPDLNSVNSVVTGDSVLRNGSYANHEVIVLNSTHSVGLIASYKFAPGVYAKQGGGDKSGFYLPSKYGNRGLVTANAIADPFQVIQAYYSPQKLCGVSIFNGKVCTKANFDVSTQAVLLEENLVFTGKTGTVLNFSYRKNSNDDTKPDVLTAISHDLKDGTEFNFGEARFDIIEATHESLTYRVLSNLNSL